MTAICLLLMLLAGQQPEGAAVQVGSKSFTESVVLGELLVQLGQQEAGLTMRHRAGLGGTRLVWNALQAGEIDLYPDYTGTIAQEILLDESLRDRRSLERALARHGVRMTGPLGFNNTYAVAMQREVAERLGIASISDLKGHPELRFGFSNEFMDRSDGWPGLRRRYGLPQTRVRGLEHALAYRALDGGDIDAMDIYSTDAHIQAYDLKVLADDLEHFPRYEAVILYRADLQQRAAGLVEALGLLEGRIDEAQMTALNYRVDVQQASERRAAAELLAGTLGIGSLPAERDSRQRQAARLARLWQHTWEHLLLVSVSLGAAILVAVPLGVLGAKRPALGQGFLTAAEIIQTIPALAMLIFLLGPVRLVGLSAIGPAPAIAALFLYSLLPILRNTYAGMQAIPGPLRESAAALGLSASARLWQIELPLASRLILAGIKTTAVINVGYATLGGLIGAGGYGELIMQGLRRSSEARMLEGAIPAALLALAVRGLFECCERWLVPRGLRLKAGS